MSQTTFTGTVKFFNEDKGYGFIIRDDSNKEVFFHRSGISEGQEINKNSKVEFNIEDGRKGKTAVNVTKV